MFVIAWAQDCLFFPLPVLVFLVFLEFVSSSGYSSMRALLPERVDPYGKPSSASSQSTTSWCGSSSWAWFMGSPVPLLVYAAVFAIWVTLVASFVVSALATAAAAAASDCAVTSIVVASASSDVAATTASAAAAPAAAAASASAFADFAASVSAADAAAASALAVASFAAASASAVAAAASAAGCASRAVYAWTVVWSERSLAWDSVKRGCRSSPYGPPSWDPR